MFLLLIDVFFLFVSVCGKSAVFLMESTLMSHGSSKSNKKPSDESRTTQRPALYWKKKIANYNNVKFDQ
jgi:hypothetical protein